MARGTDEIKAAALRLADEHRARAPFRPLDGAVRPKDLDGAYRVQDALLDIWQAGGSEVGGRGAIGGWKIALTSKVMQDLVGLDQCCAGAIFAGAIHQSPARLSAADFTHLGIEFEIALWLGADLTETGTPHDRDSVAAAVSHCLPAFELVEDRGADYRGLDGITLVADNCWNAGVVLGAPPGAPLGGQAGDWRSADLVNATGRLTINGVVAGEGRAGDAMGHPFEALAWVANHLIGRGRYLRAGDIIMTGSMIETKFPAPGDNVSFAIDGLGKAELDLAP